jgi:hypothetical protein
MLWAATVGYVLDALAIRLSYLSRHRAPAFEVQFLLLSVQG